MGLLLDGDDLPGLGKGRQNLSERGANGRQSAVKQNQRSAGAVDLVVHVEAIDGCIPAVGVFVHVILLYSKRDSSRATVGASAEAAGSATPTCCAGLPHVVGEVGGQPAIRPDREQDELASGACELCSDEGLSCLFGQIAAGDGEHLLGGRRT